MKYCDSAGKWGWCLHGWLLKERLTLRAVILGTHNILCLKSMEQFVLVTCISISVCLIFPFASFFKLCFSLLLSVFFYFLLKKNDRMACLPDRLDWYNRTCCYCQLLLVFHQFWSWVMTCALSFFWEITLVDHMGSCVLLLSFMCFRANTLGGNCFVLYTGTILYC